MMVVTKDDLGNTKQQMYWKMKRKVKETYLIPLKLIKQNTVQWSFKK